MITQFKLFENNSNISSWLSFYIPNQDKIKDLKSKIQSITKTSNDGIKIMDYEDIRLITDDNEDGYYYVYDSILENFVVIMIYETETDDYIESYNINYDEVPDNDMIKLYDLLIERIKNDEIDYGLVIFSETIYSLIGMKSIQEIRYNENKELLKNIDWIYNDFDLLSNLTKHHEALETELGDIYDWSKRIIQDFPEEYKKYLKFKKSK